MLPQSTSTSFPSCRPYLLIATRDSENLKHERAITLPQSVTVSLTFGVSLEQLMGPDGESSPVPRVIRDCVEYLRSEGPLGLNLEVEGLFRRSPNSAVLRSVREAYDRGAFIIGY